MNLVIHRSLFLIIFVFSSSSLFADVRGEIRKLSLEISKAYKDKNPEILIAKNLAVMNLSDSTESLKKASVGQTISAFLSAAFSQSTLFRLVEREGLAKVMKEQTLALSGAVSEESAIKAGNLLGAEILLEGRVGEVGDEIVVSVRLIDAEKGSVVVSKTITLKRDEVIKEAGAYVASTFQSAFGISFALVGKTGFSIDKQDYQIAIVGPEFGYKFSKYFNAGVGFVQMFGLPPSGSETIIPASNFYKFADSSYETYFYSPNFYASGGKIFAELLIPIKSRFNLGFRGEVALFPDPRMKYDVYGLPIVETAYNGGASSPSNAFSNEVAYRSIKVYGYGFEPLWTFTGEINFSFLISKRLSVFLNVGYMYAPTWKPTAFEAKGNVQESSQTFDQKTDADSLAKFNGTFNEFFDANFSTDRKNSGQVYDFGGSTITVGLGIALNF